MASAKSCSTGFRSVPSCGAGIKRKNGLEVHKVKSMKPELMRPITPNTRLEKVIESTTRQLEDETFVSRAPAKVVESMRTKLAEYAAQLTRNRYLLNGLDQ